MAERIRKVACQMETHATVVAKRKEITNVSVYLYHPKHFSRSRRVESITAPIHKRLYEEQCSMPQEEWSRLYKKVSKIADRVDRGYYMQWCSLLQDATGVPRPLFDFRLFSFGEMREIRRRLRRHLNRGLEGFELFCRLDDRWSRLTYQCWVNTLRWAEEIFSNGLKSNCQVYLG